MEYLPQDYSICSDKSCIHTQNCRFSMYGEFPATFMPSIECDGYKAKPNVNLTETIRRFGQSIGARYPDKNGQRLSEIFQRLANEIKEME